MLDFSQIKLGSVVVFNNAPSIITKCDFLRMQQRKPVKKCNMKNIITGANQEYSFKSGESIEEAELKREPASFMYITGENMTFMLSASYETIDLPKSLLDEKAEYLKEGLEVIILYFNENPISIDLPVKISYLVTSTAPAVKGNTVSSIMKEATIETGKVVRVPAFIEAGEKVIINTVEDEYVEREK